MARSAACPRVSWADPKAYAEPWVEYNLAAFLRLEIMKVGAEIGMYDVLWQSLPV